MSGNAVADYTSPGHQLWANYGAEPNSDRFSTLFTSSFTTSTIQTDISGWISTSLINASTVNVTDEVSTMNLVVSTIKYQANNVYLGNSAGAIQGVTVTPNAYQIGIGYQAGYTNQNEGAIAVGRGAGASYQGVYGIAIGEGTASAYQGYGAIAIGAGAGGNTQGMNSIAIGQDAAIIGSQPANSIFIDATGGTGSNNPAANSFCVAPIRNAAFTNLSTLQYNPSTYEIFYTDAVENATPAQVYTSSIQASTIWTAPDGFISTPALFVSSINGQLPSGAAGCNTAVQYNSNGVFGADTSFLYDTGTRTLNVPVAYTSSLVCSTLTVNGFNGFTYADSHFDGNFLMGAASNVTSPSFIAYPTNFIVGDLTNAAREISLTAGVLGIGLNSAAAIDMNAVLGVSITGGGTVAIQSVGGVEVSGAGNVAITALGGLEVTGGTVLVDSLTGVEILGGGGVSVTGGLGVSVVGGAGVVVSGGAGVGIIGGGGLTVGSAGLGGNGITSWGADISSKSVGGGGNYYADKVYYGSSINVSTAVVQNVLQVSSITSLSNSMSLLSTGQIIGYCPTSDYLTSGLSISSLSSINGIPWNGGALAEVSTFQDLHTSSIIASTITLETSGYITSVDSIFRVNTQSIRIGDNAGKTSQSGASIAIGVNAGSNSQGGSLAIGLNAGNTGQSVGAVALGTDAGYGGQGNFAIAIGEGAGQANQSANCIAIGQGAGNSGQGVNSISIGYNASGGGAPQPGNSIYLNATGNTTATTNPVANTFCVAPVRNLASFTTTNLSTLQYDPTTKEISYTDAANNLSNLQTVSLSSLFASVSSFTVSSINGIQISDIVNTNTFDQVFTSSLSVSTITAAGAGSNILRILGVSTIVNSNNSMDILGINILSNSAGTMNAQGLNIIQGLTQLNSQLFDPQDLCKFSTIVSRSNTTSTMSTLGRSAFNVLEGDSFSSLKGYVSSFAISSINGVELSNIVNTNVYQDLFTSSLTFSSIIGVNDYSQISTHTLNVTEGRVSSLTFGDAQGTSSVASTILSENYTFPNTNVKIGNGANVQGLTTAQSVTIGNLATVLGSFAVAVGAEANASTGTTSVGYQAGNSLTQNCTNLGYRAGANGSSNNTSIGYNVGSFLASGSSNNTLVGYEIGSAGVGCNCILIGTNIGAGVGTQNANIVLNAGGDFNTVAAQPSSFYVNPIRYDSSYASYSNLFFNPATSEVVQGGVPNFTIPGNIQVSTLVVSSIGLISSISTNVISFTGTNIDIGTVFLSLSTYRTTVGSEAGGTNITGKRQGNFTVAVGGLAGAAQGNYTTAVGYQAGWALVGSNQDTGATAIGARSQLYGAGNYAVAVGYAAGYDTTFSAGQSANSIAINASGLPLPALTASACYIKPLRGLLPYSTNPLNSQAVISSISYDPLTAELTYSDARLYQQLFTSSFQASTITTSSILANFGYISTLSTQNLTVSSMTASTISTAFLYASNAFFSTLNTSSLSTYTLAAISANISTLYVSSISSFTTYSGTANFSSLNVSSIIFTSSLGSNALFSTLNTSSIVTARYNGALTNGITMPKSYFSTAGAVYTPGATNVFSSYISFSVSSLAANYSLNATVPIFNGVAVNTVTAGLFVNGTQVNFSTSAQLIANTTQTLALTYNGALPQSSTNTVTIQMKQSGTTAVASNGSVALITNLL